MAAPWLGALARASRVELLAGPPGRASSTTHSCVLAGIRRGASSASTQIVRRATAPARWRGAARSADAARTCGPACASGGAVAQRSAGAVARGLRTTPRRMMAAVPDAEGTERGRRGPVSWATLALVVAGGAAWVGYYVYEKKRLQTQTKGKVESFGKPALGGPWSLVDSEGKPVTDADFRGEYVLMYFGFTFCPDICPNELVKMGKVVQALDAQKNLPKLTPIFVTLDPHRDTVAQMAAYRKDFHPRMLALTGTPGQIARVAKAFRVYFSDVDREDDADDYIVDHSIVMYLMGPDGEFREFFTQLSEPHEIIDKIGAIMRAEAQN